MAADNAEGERLYLPEAGFRYTYGFERSIDFTGDLAGAKMPRMAFKGEFYVDVLRADSTKFEALLSEQIDGATAPQRGPLARIDSDAQGNQVSFFKTGDLTDIERQHVAVVKDLAALWLFPLRTDTVGAFEARFEPIPAEAGFTREKKVKLGYASKGPNTPEILSSEHFLLWDNSLHIPKEVNGTEVTKLGKGSSALTADSRYRLQFRDSKKSPIYSASMLAAIGDKDEIALDTKNPSETLADLTKSSSSMYLAMP
jgi:hypothetical protein